MVFRGRSVVSRTSRGWLRVIKGKAIDLTVSSDEYRHAYLIRAASGNLT